MPKKPASHLLHRKPPDDTGSDTFRRYKYQAKVVFPYFLRCGLEGDELSVIPEHFEDLTLEYSKGWRFIQIKTRDPGQGMWALSALVGEDGALQSLYRTYEATADLDATYELHLEQLVSPKGPAGDLGTPEGRAKPGLVKAVAKGLGINTSRAKAFLSKVRLAPPLPPREHIDAVNLRLLQSHSPALTHAKAHAMYERALTRIESAMSCDALPIAWPAYVRGLNGPEAADAQALAKRLSQAECKAVVGPLSAHPSRLLSRVLDSSLPRPTDLEMKLMAAGVPPGIIEDAKLFRANAVAVEFEAQNLTPGSAKPLAFEGDNAALSDVQQRILSQLKSVAATHFGSELPGPRVWDGLMERCHQHANKLDPQSVFSQDPILLVGEACELSDQCLSGWGVKDAK